MPRAASAKAAGAASKAAPKKPSTKRKANGYQMPEPIPLGAVFTDLSKQQWKVGPAIGSGGFGEIYCACKATEATKIYDDYQYVIKVEPHGNGPLFVEMHFYMRNAKAADIDTFRKKRGLKALGMPHFVGHGSHEVNSKRHRFIVVPRFGSDVWSLYLANARKMPLHTAYRLAIQMLDVYEYMHECTYVHGDLKGANILLGYGPKAANQAYLVDFGLASHYTTKDFKPDPKKMHNGTIEYTSRDAHQGVPTMRGDMEILAYNLIQWTGGELPWEKNKLLAVPAKVQQAKEELMSNVSARLKDCYADQQSPDVVQSYVAYAAKLKYDEKPDYDKCRKEFDKALKAMGKTNAGDLEFKAAAPAASKKAAARAPAKETKRSSAKYVVIDSDDDDDLENISPKRKAVTTTRKRLSRSTDRHGGVASPVKKVRGSSAKPTTQSRKAPAASPKPTVDESPAESSVGAKSGASASKTKKPKTLNLNFELDISFDANIVVNVTRKPKKTAPKKESQALDDSKHNESVDEIPASDRSIVVQTKVVRKGTRSSPRAK